MGVSFMGIKQSSILPIRSANSIGRETIEERACTLARYIIDSKDTVRGAAKKFRYFKKYST